MKTPLPLNAMNAFAAAGRNGSFLIAARDLGVTPAAISQLVRKLETHLGKTLFQRLNNRVLLTDAGKSLLQSIVPALDELSEAAQRASRSGTRRRLRVSCVPSLAECWLVQQLPRFLTRHPRLRIDLTVEEDVTPGHWDIRINYGRLPDDDLVQEELCRDAVAPLCAPSHLAATGRERDLTAADSAALIHTQWGPSYGSNVTWKDWFQQVAPRERVDLSTGHQVSASRTALQLAESGCGIALGQGPLAQAALDAGRLVALSRHSLPLGQSYVIAMPAASHRQADVQAFAAWLLAEITSAAPAPRPHPPATPTRPAQRSASRKRGKRRPPRSE